MSSKEEREQRLLLLLSKKQEYVTSGELAEELNISNKTVYRLIKGINDQSSDGILIASEKGRGYRLNYQKYMNRTHQQLSRESQVTPSERRKRVMEELLLSSPRATNVYQLYEKFFVGDSVISSDEQLISKELAQYNLSLERKNRTMAIIGEEANIRKAISDLIQLLNIIDIDELKHNETLNFNNYDVLFVLDQLRLIEKRLDIVIPHPYNVNIFSHLYILISRSRKVGTSLFTMTETVSQEEKQALAKEPILRQISKDIIYQTEQYLNESLPEVETYYLYQYLVSSRMQDSLEPLAIFSPEVSKVTQLYLDEMSRQLHLSMTNEPIFIDLANHIKPMLNRLEHNIHVKNSLLDQIKMVYEDIFKNVSKISSMISETYQLPEISADENGFITLYFARMIETNQLPIRTLIMCTTGIGTSELLKVKVAKKFPELEIVAVVSTRDAKQFLATYPDIELILTTIHLNHQVSIKTLLVSAMFTGDDQKMLQTKIEEIYDDRH
ncbi:PRD domain-containing protein [Vagococcus sp. BWB3-3]|uniref:PRD domain-containing protein n=1 Tax=Vagococcus allomyrinae TaxID=2794353 RepID=A0A940P6E1_9ENTE|nr:PRD domain-containing protein [Vagococcus allomyrinae]MBP1042469.1 PRD domain-containing protein [Vagococcus allomyrinae]